MATDLPEILNPLLDYLSDNLPQPIFSVVTSILTHSFALISSVFAIVGMLITSAPSTWDAEKILPPIITLFAAYLALLSFYRTTGWMIRSMFAMVKWGFILSALGGAAGYFIANANGGNGVGFGGGLIPTLGGMLLDMINGGGQNAAGGRRDNTGHSRPRSSRQRQPPRPKPWESWDKHEDWQYRENQDGNHGSNGVQDFIGRILGSAGQTARESGWWEAAKGVVDEFGQSLQQEDTAGDAARKQPDAKSKSKGKKPKSR
ncbi:hypothetical protein PHLCEN_2v10301 [Hermanssonia centrifuga]|uniref:Uncharacterized protein n=1 Tax=Hermanssonia centrifuga TaxID=98765 RepID=A0A2R6NNC2_9APHY|nr:hypothetical protein PHLCEN_2v10301 [Hermanssonia centrifuga]